MFERVIINPNQSRALPVNLGQIMESLFFYQNTTVFVGRNEISALIRLMDTDTFITLLRRPEINVLYNNSRPGVVMDSEETLLSVAVISHANFDIEKSLYEIYLEYSNDEEKSKDFARRVAPILGVHYLPDNFNNQLSIELNDQTFRKAVMEETLKYHNPSIQFDFQTTNFDLEHVGLDPFGQAQYKVHSNFDFSQYAMSPSGIILNIINGTTDLYLASLASSEIILPDINSRIVRAKVSDIITKTNKSRQEIETFNHYVYDETIQIKEAINSGRDINEFFKILDKAEKQKHWLQDLPNESNLLREYIKKSGEKTWLEHERTKAVRFYLFNGLNTIIGLTMGLPGVAVGIGLSAFNSFFLDKLITKWRPNQFIEQELIPTLKKK